MNVENITKERFLEAKKRITKKYPGAKTIMDPEGKYYVATEEGRDICNLQVGQTINNYNFDGEADSDYEKYGRTPRVQKISECVPYEDQNTDTGEYEDNYEDPDWTTDSYRWKKEAEEITE